MKSLALLLLFLPLSAAASHGWSGFDICKAYEDKLPPGLTVASLPDPGGPGAVLLGRYCTQCHNLPGPDRHTAGEWHRVTSRMFLLMEVSHRFGGLMGRVEVMREAEQETLLGYLEAHAADAAAPQGREKGRGWRSSLLALAPFLALVVLGGLRWWRRRRAGHTGGGRPCTTE